MVGDPTTEQQYSRLADAGLNPINPGGSIAPVSSPVVNNGNNTDTGAGGGTPGQRWNSTTGAYEADPTFNTGGGGSSGPQTEDQIYAQRAKQAQDQVNALKAEESSALASQGKINDQNTRSTDSISTLTGLSGSSEAGVQASATANKNEQANKAIRDQYAAKVSDIFATIRNNAVTEARNQQLDARQAAQDQITNAAAKQKEVQDHLAFLASVGATAEGIKASLNPNDYAYMVKYAGGEDALRKYLFSQRAKDSIVGSPTIVGNHVVQYYKTVDGQIKAENVLLPAGVNLTETKNVSVEKAGDGSLYIFDHNKGTMTPVAGTATPIKMTDMFGNEYIAGQGGSGAVRAGAENAGLGTAGGNGAPSGKLNFDQYGLLAHTDFNPSNTVDALAQKYLDTYLKTGTIPSASTMGRNMKPGVVAQIDTRARELYFKATGNAMPNPEVLKGYQDIINNNNQMANNLKVQEQTVSANVDFSLENMKKNDLNSIGFKPLDNFINTIKNMTDDPAVGQLIAQNTTIQNELGSLLAVKNAGGTTVYDKLSSAGIITSSDGPEQIKSKVDALLKEASNFAKSINSANGDLYKQIDPMMQDPNNPLRQSYQKIPAELKTLASTKNISESELIASVNQYGADAVTKFLNSQ